jgi:hypothetical protein
MVGRNFSRSYSRARLRRARCSRCLAASGSIPNTAAAPATGNSSHVTSRRTSASVRPSRASAARMRHESTPSTTTSSAGPVAPLVELLETPIIGTTAGPRRLPPDAHDWSTPSTPSPVTRNFARHRARSAGRVYHSNGGCHERLRVDRPGVVRVMCGGRATFGPGPRASTQATPQKLARLAWRARYPVGAASRTVGPLGPTTRSCTTARRGGRCGWQLDERGGCGWYGPRRPR